MKRVLVTGACGNIGANVVDLLLERGYPVRAVDLDTAAGRRVATRWGDRVDLRFGSICNESVVREAVAGIDHVIHLAAMVPPGTDVDQAAGYAVNVVAMRSIIAACEAQASPPRLTFTSTAAIWGRNDEVERPRRADEAISPSDNYSRQKAECESMLRACALDTVIFRIAMTPPVAPGALSPFVFDMHPDMRVEFTHPKDQALAICNSLVVAEIAGRTLCLGGGEKNRYRYREFMNMAFGAMGIAPLPRSAFGDALFLTDWVDSEESQSILDYQRRDA
ncbi:MAG: NAD(P)-dependent oxidoreductase, partial [Polyangiales bacterium]